MAKAEQDYQTVIVLSRQRKKKLPDIVCYHAQQCAEKYLKAMMAKHDIKIPKNHDLVFLADKLKKVEPELELAKDMLSTLSQYAVEFRYPGESATKKDAKQAVKQIKQLRNIFRERMALLC